MSNRHSRRKAAKAANVERTEQIIAANAAYERALIVKRNLSTQPERNFYPAVSCIGNMAGQSHRAYICRASGGMGRQRAMALKAQGKW